MQGYYDWHPATHLDRPVALVGFLGAAVAQTAQAICALTGLPLADLARRVESAAGKGVSHIVLRDGDAALRQAERAQLTAALAQAPPPVIALTDGALLDPTSRADVEEAATLVWLDAPLPVLADRARAARAAHPAAFPQFMTRGARITEDALLPLLNVRLPAYQQARHRVEIGRRTPTEVAREIIERLGLTGP